MLGSNLYSWLTQQIMAYLTLYLAIKRQRKKFSNQSRVFLLADLRCLTFHIFSVYTISKKNRESIQLYFIHFIGTRLPEAWSGANIDENSKDGNDEDNGNFDNDIMTVKKKKTGIRLRIITFQMDVSNYYPMKELLRDKYFDEGKRSFSLLFNCNIALYLILFFYFLTQYAKLKKFPTFRDHWRSARNDSWLYWSHWSLCNQGAEMLIVGVHHYLCFTFHKFWFKAAV